MAIVSCLRTIFGVLLVMFGLFTANQSSTTVNLLNDFAATDSNDGGGSANDVVLSCDFFHLQKRLVPSAPDCELERSLIAPTSDNAPEKCLAKISTRSFWIPTTSEIAQIGLSPRAPSVI